MLMVLILKLFIIVVQNKHKQNVSCTYVLLHKLKIGINKYKYSSLLFVSIPNDINIV